MYLGTKAFSNCKSLQALKIPETLSVLGTYVFAGCTALSDFKIPERFNNQIDDLFSSVEADDDAVMEFDE